MNDRSKPKGELIAQIVILEGDVEVLRERCAIKDAEIERLRRQLDARGKGDGNH